MRPYDNPSMESYLIHHGILGQKWGVRRFQNLDGSYTEAGKKRYGMSKKDVEKAVKGAQKSYKKGKDFWTKIGEIGYTGDNWKDVREKHQEEVHNDKKLQSLQKEYTKLIYDPLWDVESEFPTDEQKELKARTDEVMKAFGERANEIGQKYYHDYQDAILKDIGYKDIELGREMLDEYGIENYYAKYHASLHD